MAIWTPTSVGNGTALGVDDYTRTGFPGGSDALDPDNPEVGKSDDAQVDLNFFSAGVHAYTKWSGGTDLWTQIGVFLERTAGPLGPGAPGGLAEVRIKKRFLLAAINDYSGGEAPIIAIAGPGVNPTFAKNILQVVLMSGSGTSSVWRFRALWDKFGTPFGGQSIDSADISYADLEVDSDRDILYRVQGVTAGQTDFSGTIQDGSILVEMDNVEYINTTGIDPYIHWVSGNPGVRDQFQRLGLGLAGLLGPIWPVSVSDEITVSEYEPIVDVSEPCCGSGSTGPVTGATGDIPIVDPTKPHNPGASTTTCVGGGTVPTASDLTDNENWRTLLGPTPDVSCQLIAVKHPSTLGVTTYRWADKLIDLPGESSFAEGRVRRLGWTEIRRAMALPDQYPEIGQAGVTIDEQDALLRALLDEDSTSYIIAREWVEWLVSAVGRRASTVMRCLFRGVVASLNPGVGRTYTITAEEQITSPAGIFNGSKLVPQAVMDHEFFGPGRAIYPSNGQPSAGLHKDLVNKPLPILGGICSDRGATSAPDVNGITYSAEKGAVPCIWTGDVYLPGHLTQIFGELLVCLGEIGGIEDVYGSDLGYDGATPSNPPRAPRRVHYSTGTYGVDVFVPGGNGWPFPDNYIERTVNGKTLRYTAIYVRGPRMQHHRDGLINITVNVCGPLGLNGQVINQAGLYLQWFYNEHVAKNAGAGYRSGAYHILETYVSDAAVPYVQPTTFNAFQDYTKDRMGNAVGYVVKNFQLREQLPLREIEKRFMQDYEAMFPFNHFGQKMLRWVNDLADITLGTLYKERIEIDGPLPPYVDAQDEIENSLAVLHDRDHDLNTWRQEPFTLRDENSIIAHRGVIEGGKRRADGEPPSPYEVWSTADTDTVRDVFARRLIRRRVAPRYQPVPSNLAALHDELGDQIRVTDTHGVGLNGIGYVERPFLVLTQTHNPSRHTTALRCLDLKRITAGVGGWADESAFDWDSASAAERDANAFWAAEDGTIPSDNSPAKEWR